MPFVLLLVGVAFIVTAIRGTTSQLFTLLKGDFSGSGNFLYWFISILLIGAVGYIKKLQPVSDAFLVLVLIVFVVVNNKQSGTAGFFGSFVDQLKNPVTTNGTSSSSTSATSTGGSNALSDAFGSMITSNPMQLLTPYLFTGK